MQIDDKDLNTSIMRDAWQKEVNSFAEYLEEVNKFPSTSDQYWIVLRTVRNYLSGKYLELSKTYPCATDHPSFTPRYVAARGALEKRIIDLATSGD